MKVQLFSSFRELAGGRQTIDLETGGAVKLRDVIRELDRLYPGFVAALLDRAGNLMEGAGSVLVNGRNVAFLDGLETVVPPDAVVSFIPPSAGG